MARELQIEEGMIVEYLARKISDDMPIQIYSISKIVTDVWERSDKNEPCDSKTERVKTHNRVILGRVMKREGASVVVETNESHMKLLQVELNEISCNFVPMCGDEVSLLTLYQTDKGSFNCSGQPIGVFSLKPADRKEVVGTIGRFPKGSDFGIIDDIYVFYLDALQNANNLTCKPDVGDSVIAEVIRSQRRFANYKTYDWRCIRISTNEAKRKRDPISKKELKPRQDENRDEVSITSSVDLRVNFNALNERKLLKLSIKNSSDRPKTLTSTTIKEQICGSQIECDDFNKSYTIPSQQKLTFDVKVVAKLYGVSRVTIVFSFDGQLTLDRIVEIEVLPPRNENEPNDALQPKQNAALFSKQVTKSLWKVQGDIVSGVRVKAAPLFVFNRFKHFEVPERLLNTLLDSTLTFAEMDLKLNEVMPIFDRLDFSNYKDFFQGLLHLEEIALDHEFRKYDRELAHFHREGEYLALKIENVHESRPSIIIGDKVIARDPFEEGSDVKKPILYEGFVHKIRKDHLLIKFGETFHNRYSGEDYRLFFKFARSKFVKQLNAVERMSKAKDSSIIFPTKIHVNSHLQFNVSLVNGQMKANYRKKDLPWCNKSLNIVQKKAIVQILRGETRPMPYVIFGPPGTGKTSTLIELILQLFKNVGGSRIIVCAPSNSAANLLTQRLIESKQLEMGEFIRIVGINSIEREQIPDELHPYCAITDIATPNTASEPSHIQTNSGLILNTNSVGLAAYRVLISTCMSFGSLMCMKFHRSHFTHVIVDEAGQCLESEAMIPISLLNSTNSQIVLAGDPMQIGPIALSKFAQVREFEKSFLVRLLDRVPYKRFIENAGTFSYDERLVTKLLYNYRSLPSILSSYNELFYDDELIPTILPSGSEESSILKKIKTDVLKGRSSTENFGIFFFGIRGREEQIAASTSWRNPAETGAVISLLR